MLGPWLVVAYALLVLLVLVPHAWGSRGRPLSTVPRWLWILGLLSLDPLVAIAYVYIVVAGAALAGTARRTWMAYGVFAVVACLQLAPLSQRERGVFPDQSPRSRGILDRTWLSCSIGGARTSNRTSVAIGNGWLVGRAVVITDGDPVSCAVAERVAGAMQRAGVPRVDFVNSAAALPAPAGDVVVSIGVHGVSSINLMGVAYWSGDVSLAIDERSFSHAPYQHHVDGSSGDKRRWGDNVSDLGGGALWSRWRVQAARLGSVWGAGSCDFVLKQLTGLEDGVESLLTDEAPGGLRWSPSSVAQGRSQPTGVEEILAPWSPQQLLAGATMFSDQTSCWRVDLGRSPEQSLTALVEQLEVAGWSDVLLSEAFVPSEYVRRYKFGHVSANREIGGDRQYLQVMPSRAGMFDAGAYAESSLTSSKSDRPTRSMTRYVVHLVERFGQQRFAALSEQLLDTNGDVRLLQVMGRAVPAARYSEWRERVLACDASWQNLRCVAMQDAERGRSSAAKSLIHVADWVSVTPRLGSTVSERARQEVAMAGRSVGIKALKAPARLDPERLHEAVMPVLSEAWRRVPFLASEYKEPTDEPDYGFTTLGRQKRSFVALDADGEVLLLSVELVNVVGKEDRLVLNVHGDRRQAFPIQQVAAAPVGVTKSGGRFEVRDSGGLYAVRWLARP